MLRALIRMATETPAKKVKTSPPLIGTHSGTFHADEALAVYLLRLLPSYTNSPLLRTRDPALLETCHTVVDVGGEYEASRNRFDHHQRTFGETFPGFQTKLSSAGLVYMHFGQEIIRQVMASAAAAEASARGAPVSEPTTTQPSDADVETLYKKLYADFIEPLDANDNGISAHPPASSGGPTPAFKTFGTTLPSLVSDLNYPLDLPPPTSVPTCITDTMVLTPSAPGAAPLSEDDRPQAAEDARFQQASTLMGTAFVRKLHLAFQKWLPAKRSVVEAYNSRTGVDPSGRIMVLPSGGVPWKEHLYSIEKETGVPEDTGADADGRVWFVLYPEAEVSGKWRVQAVSKGSDSFENRRGLREEWRGVRDQDLSTKAGIEGCVFVHAAGFIGGNATMEGALEMARRSLVD